MMKNTNRRFAFLSPLKEGLAGSIHIHAEWNGQVLRQMPFLTNLEDSKTAQIVKLVAARVTRGLSASMENPRSVITDATDALAASVRGHIREKTLFNGNVSTMLVPPSMLEVSKICKFYKNTEIGEMRLDVQNGFSC